MSLLADKPRPTEGAHTHSAETMVPDQSRAERKTSYAVADFPVPGGREEDWRFTPVDRLSGLFAEEDSAERAVTVESEAPEGVELLSLPMDDERVGTAYRPADRAAVTAWAGTERALYVGVAKEAELDAPVFVRLTGTGAGRGNGHTVIEAGRHSRATVVLQHFGSAQHNAGVEIRVGDGADLTVVSVQEWTTTRSTSPSTTPSSGATPTSSTSSSRSAARSCACRPTPGTPAPVARSRPSASTSPTPASTRSTASSSTTRRRTAPRTSSTRAHCRATPPTPSGSATC